LNDGLILGAAQRNSPEPLYGEKSINIVELSNDLLGWFNYPILYPCRT
jgi:hypothetical protein